MEDKANGVKEYFISLGSPVTNEIDHKNNIVFLGMDEKKAKQKQLEQEQQKEKANEEDSQARRKGEDVPTDVTDTGDNGSKAKPENVITDNFFPVIQRFRYVTIYETRSRLYVVGTLKGASKYRVLKLDRERSEDALGIDLDPMEYSSKQMQGLLQMLNEANKTHGMKVIGKGFGIVGFVRFIHGYYLIIITQKTKKGTIGPHHIYSVQKTAHYYIPRIKPPTDYQENRYKTLFFQLDFTDLHYSYTYDLTRTLQHNLTHFGTPHFDKRFVWNHYLVKPILQKEGNNCPWVLPMIHGFFAQKTISQHGRLFSMSIIARRSRYFAGTRYLKRGVNSQGRVANDVETEQIAEDMNYPVLHSDGHFSSHVQIRGSIPLFWGQEPRTLTPKPPIFVQRCDPLYSATKLHFKDLLCRFGSPIFVLNLVKKVEKKPRESILRKELCVAIDQINDALPPEFKIQYIAWDFSRAQKSESENIITQMTTIAERSLTDTGFFHSGKQLNCANMFVANHIQEGYSSNAYCKMQNGVLRSNCIDSLDRTNAAQFVIGKVAMGYQLYVMGLIGKPILDFEDPICDALMYLYQDMGNTLAIQYGGSELAHTMKSYNATGNSLTSRPRDMFTSFRRYYSNSFMDNEKQDSINLFLGNYRPWQETTDLWDLETDYYLHMKDPSYSDKQLLCTEWWRESVDQYNRNKHFRNDYVPFRCRPETRLLCEMFFLEAYNFGLTFFDKKIEAKHAKPLLLHESQHFNDVSKSTVYYGGHRKKTFVFSSNPNLSTKNSTSGFIWDPISEPHPDFTLAQKQMERIQLVAGPLHNLLSRHNIKLIVPDRTLEIYNSYLHFGEPREEHDSNKHGSKKLLTTGRRNPLIKSHLPSLGSGGTYVSFDERVITRLPTTMTQSMTQLTNAPLRDRKASSAINVHSSTANTHTPSSLATTTSNVNAKLQALRKSTRMKDLYSGSTEYREMFYQKVIDNVKEIPVLNDNNPVYRKFAEFQKKQERVKTNYTTLEIVLTDLNVYIASCTQQV